MNIRCVNTPDGWILVALDDEAREGVAALYGMDGEADYDPEPTMKGCSEAEFLRHVNEHALLLGMKIGVEKGEPTDTAVKAPGIELLLCAAKGGDVAAQWKLGSTYYSQYLRTESSNELAEAAHWIEEAARQGHHKAEAALGGMYLFGKGRERNLSEAQIWLHKAAANGVPDAEFAIGKMYILGQGVTPNDHEAARWMLLAAEHGFADAQACLGGMFINGKGVGVDGVQAERWVRKAAEQGHPVAELTLGEMYLRGDGVEVDLQQAEEWIQRAANHGCPEAADTLQKLLLGREDQKASAKKHRRTGDKYFFGIGVPQNLRKAVDWYTRSAAEGDGDAQFTLAHLYLSGKGIRKNPDEASQLLYQAKMQGDLEVFNRRLHKKMLKYFGED